ncbi:hypothetical protein BH23CHL7_BH23CHL7_17180 [soil metagenome]
MNTIFGREPVMILAVIQAAIALAVGFGLNWSGDQVALVTAFSAAVLGLIARQQVSPTG